jgi:hypothetical protein
MIKIHPEDPGSRGMGMYPTMVENKQTSGWLLTR